MIVIEQPNYRLELANATTKVLDELEAYYGRRNRPPKVFRRTRQALKNSAQSKLFLLLRDTRKEIVAAGGIHTFEIQLPTSAGKEPHPVPVVFAEFGSLWRAKKEPKGIVAKLFYAAGILRTLERARDLNIYKFTTQIVRNDKEGFSRLERLNFGLAPFHPNEFFSNAFKSSIADNASTKIPLLSFIARLDIAAVNAAKSVLGRNGHTFSPHTNPDWISAKVAGGREVTIDLSRAHILPIARATLLTPSGCIVDYKSWSRANQEVSKLLAPQPKERSKERKRLLPPPTASQIFAQK